MSFTAKSSKHVDSGKPTNSVLFKIIKVDEDYIQIKSKENEGLLCALASNSSQEVQMGF